MSRFITFEGIEGSGKTTQIQMLSNYLEEQGIDHLLTREPGGTPIGDRIRRLVLSPDSDEMSPTCEMLLYGAARAQHIAEVIVPALAEGRTVLCDRFTDATFAYQGYGRDLPLDLIRRLHAIEPLALKPDLTLLFDIDASIAVERARVREGGTVAAQNRFEMEDLEFHERVRAGYLDLVREEPARVIVVDAAGEIPEVQQRVIKAVTLFLHTRGAPE